MFFPDRSFRFDETHLVKPGDPVVVLRFYGLEYIIGDAIREALIAPQNLEAHFKGVKPMRNATRRQSLGKLVASIMPDMNPDSLVVPHIGIRIPREVLGARRGVLLTVTAPDCDWTLPDIYAKSIAEVSDIFKPTIPDALPPEW